MAAGDRAAGAPAGDGSNRSGRSGGGAGRRRAAAGGAAAEIGPAHFLSGWSLPAARRRPGEVGAAMIRCLGPRGRWCSPQRATAVHGSGAAPRSARTGPERRRETLAAAGGARGRPGTRAPGCWRSPGSTGGLGRRGSASKAPRKPDSAWLGSGQTGWLLSLFRGLGDARGRPECEHGKAGRCWDGRGGWG
ncbi:spidroin-1-like [Ananas comosus]|uniref:Spidroin-1-like n=1 Tax=Ananas comosus TaxID=4615 RepID=A0A6P5EGZ5_ANACO|nr:spidroin-1-like [Ananas comosus]